MSRIAELEAENAEYKRADAERCKLLDAIRADAKKAIREALGDALWNQFWEPELERLAHVVYAAWMERAKVEAENAALRAKLLTAAGDDLCRLTQDEIKALTGGAVQIPSKEEFLASCERFHAQVAGEVGINEQCLTLAQMIAENAALLADKERLQKLNESLAERIAKQSELLSKKAEKISLDAGQKND